MSDAYDTTISDCERISALLRTIFGDTPTGQGNAMTWLDSANGDLQGKRPVSMIVNGQSSEVRTLLEGLARGVG